MEKRSDIQIYIAFHKPMDYGIWDNSLYTPVEAGAAFREPIYEQYQRDNTGDNISEWNHIYLENTVVYWVVTHNPLQVELSEDDQKVVLGSKLKYLGFCQYRRRLEFPEDENFDDIFSQYDLVAVQPLYFPNVRRQYEFCHSKEDIDLAESIVKRLYPEYSESWDRYINKGTQLLYSNGYIMRHSDFIKWYEWLFSIFAEYRNIKGWDVPEKAYDYLTAQVRDGKRNAAKGEQYQAEIFAFLSERLWTLYAFHNYKREKILFKPFRKYEGV